MNVVDLSLGVCAPWECAGFAAIRAMASTCCGRANRFVRVRHERWPRSWSSRMRVLFGLPEPYARQNAYQASDLDGRRARWMV
jgi:hypothetical protein